MEEMNIVTKSYKHKDKYQIDLVITTDVSGTVTTDAWIGHIDGALKLHMFGLRNKTLDEVMEIIEEELEDDDMYTEGIDEADVYQK